MVGEELHTKDIIEFADAVKLYSIGVIDIEPLLLSHCIHGLTMQPPKYEQKLILFTDGRTQGCSLLLAGEAWLQYTKFCVVLHYVQLDDLLYIIDRLHHVYLAH